MNSAAETMFAKRAADAQTRIGIGVGVVVRNKRGQLLLEKRSDCGLWGLPGGRVEPGESVTQAAVREVWEETGLTIQVTRLIGVYSEPSDRILTYPDNGDVVHKIDVVLEASVLSGEIVLSSESEAIIFFDLAAVPAGICPPAKQPIEDYLKGLSSVLK